MGCGVESLPLHWSWREKVCAALKGAAYTKPLRASAKAAQPTKCACFLLATLTMRSAFMKHVAEFADDASMIRNSPSLHLIHDLRFFRCVCTCFACTFTQAQNARSPRACQLVLFSLSMCGQAVPHVSTRVCLELNATTIVDQCLLRRTARPQGLPPLSPRTCARAKTHNKHISPRM